MDASALVRLSNPPTSRPPVYAFVLLGLLAASFMAPWVSIGSLISYYSKYGQNYFVWLNCAFYFPGLPISVLQFQLDKVYDLRWGSRGTFLFRIGFCQLTIVGICLALPYCAKYATLALIGLLGVVTWSAHGTCVTLASLFSAGAVGFLQFGVQAPNVYALGLVIALGVFGMTDPKMYTVEKIFIFYYSTAVFVLLGLFCGVGMWRMNITKSTQRSYYRDIEEAGQSIGGEDSMTQRLLDNASEESLQNTATEKESSQRPSRSSTQAAVMKFRVLSAIQSHRFVLFVTIFCSISSGSFFSLVPPSDSFNISQTLYFIRLFSDLAGRLSAAALPRLGWLSSIDGLYIMTMIRIVLWIAFILYILPAPYNIIPQSDAFICILTALGSLHSGICAVLVYEYAGKSISGANMGSSEQVDGAKVLNITFHKACFSASIVAAVGGIGLNMIRD
jgi:hypothetical protein